MQENMTKSKHILFKYQTIEELIQGTGYKPSTKALILISPDMSVDSLIEKLMEINEIALACEVMIYALYPRARIWWGCSIIKSLHEELFAKSKDQKAAEEKVTMEKPEAVALPKTKEEAKEMLAQKFGEQKEAIGLPQDKKEEKNNKASDDSENAGLTNEEAKERIKKLTAQQEKQRAEQQARFEKESKMAEKQEQEALKKIEEAIAGMSPEDKAFYDQCQAKIDQYFKENMGMTKQELVDFAKKMIEKAKKADESGNPAEGQAVLKEVFSALSKNSDNIAKMFDEVIKVQEEFEQKENNNSSESKAKTEVAEEKAKAEEKTEIDFVALKKEKEEAQKAEKIEEMDAKAAEFEISFRKRAYEAAVAWVNEPTKLNTINAEIFSREGGACPEGMLCLASYWSYGDFSVNSAFFKKSKEEKEEEEKEEKEQPKTFIRVDPSLPPKGIFSTLLMSALHEGGTRKPADRFALYYQIGEKIACAEDNWTREQIKARQNQLAKPFEEPETKPEIRPEIKPEVKSEAKPKEKPEVKPTYTRWKMD